MSAVVDIAGSCAGGCRARGSRLSGSCTACHGSLSMPVAVSCSADASSLASAAALLLALCLQPWPAAATGIAAAAPAAGGVVQEVHTNGALVLTNTSTRRVVPTVALTASPAQLAGMGSASWVGTLVQPPPSSAKTASASPAADAPTAAVPTHFVCHTSGGRVTAWVDDRLVCSTVPCEPKGRCDVGGGPESAVNGTWPKWDPIPLRPHDNHTLRVHYVRDPEVPGAPAFQLLWAASPSALAAHWEHSTHTWHDLGSRSISRQPGPHCHTASGNLRVATPTPRSRPGGARGRTDASVRTDPSGGAAAVVNARRDRAHPGAGRRGQGLGALFPERHADVDAPAGQVRAQPDALPDLDNGEARRHEAQRVFLRRHPALPVLRWRPEAERHGPRHMVGRRRLRLGGL